MTIDWASFTPVAAVIGGAIIGVAVAVFAWLNGGVAGISGIVGGALRPGAGGDVAWRIAFIAGLIVAPIFFAAAAALSPVDIEAGYPTLVLAGLLVGIGTRYGGGCTSGHGVCGISRLSPRSMVATLAFMAAGVATVFVARHLLVG